MDDDDGAPIKLFAGFMAIGTGLGWSEQGQWMEISNSDADADAGPVSVN